MKKSILVVCNKQEKSVSLQQIPLEVRELFEPAPGYTFVSVDFSQAEYRTLAGLSGDKNMIDILNSDRDFYISAAAMTLHKPYEEVTKEDRSKVKTIFLGVMYDMSQFGVAKRLGVSEEEAGDLIDAWKAQFPQASMFKEKVKQYVKERGKTPEVFGRYRDFGNPADLEDTQIKEGFNTVVQSTTADLLKIAMVMSDKAIKEKDLGKMVLTLHDELLFEIKDEKLEEALQVLPEVMTSAVHRNEKWPKFKVSVNYGKNWKEASK